jgi:hypothetical protein
VSSLAIELRNKYEFIRLVLPYGFSPFVPEFDDGIDFILHRNNDDIHLNVQLKSRWTVEKKYFGRRIWIAFPGSEESDTRAWYLAPHDRMVALAQPLHAQTESWKNGGYGKPSLSGNWKEQLEEFKLESILPKMTPAYATSTAGYAVSWDV